MKPASFPWLARMRPCLHALVVLQLALVPLLTVPPATTAAAATEPSERIAFAGGEHPMAAAPIGPSQPFDWADPRFPESPDGSSDAGMAGGGATDGPDGAGGGALGHRLQRQSADPNEIVDVLIEMAGKPLAGVYQETKTSLGPAAAARRAYQVAYTAHLKQAQVPVVAAAAGYGKVTGQLTALANGVAVSGVARRDLASLSQLPGVKAVHVVPDLQLDLYRSVPFIGAEQVRTQLGLDGRGVKIAIIDTGIDYTHRNFGGPGTVDAYDFAVEPGNASVITDTWQGASLFPTAKVAGGHDFVGDLWTGNNASIPVALRVLTRTLDADPIDLDGHGTHVAGIAAGFGVPNSSVNGSIPSDFDGRNSGADPTDPPLYHGVAPAAALYAYKVCSSVSTSCSGLAMLEAMERAADPNQDGSVSDHLDVINMSIGDIFAGSPELVAAASHAVDVGIAVAVSAGNSGDVPFITGDPASADRVLSVAASFSSGQTMYGLQVTEPPTLTGGLLPMTWQPWSRSMLAPTVGSLVEGRSAITLTSDSRANLGCNVGSDAGPSPFPAGSLVGKIAVVDRGICAVSQKAYNAQRAGAVGMILVMLPGQAPLAFASAGQPVTIPAVAMANADVAPLRGVIAGGGNVAATMSFANAIDRPDLTDTLASFTSRGPGRRGVLKPDIAAPGVGIISARAGSGDRTAAMSGTSMAAPHVAGALALVRQLHPDWSPVEAEALLVNSSSPALYVGSNVTETNRAPISLAGAGRVDLVGAAQLQTTVRSGAVASIHFGIPAVLSTVTESRVITVTNHSTQTKTYALSATTQYAPPPGFSIDVSPASLTIPPGGSATAGVNVGVDGRQLPPWTLAGTGTGSGTNLSKVESGGYVWVRDEISQTAHIAWYVLPRAAADVRASAGGLMLNGFGPDAAPVIMLDNPGSVAGTASIFNLVGFDPPETAGSAFSPMDVQYVGVRYLTPGPGIVTNTVEFAVKTYGARTIPFEAEFDIPVDFDRDGVPDYAVFNTDRGALETGTFNGLNSVYVYNLRTNKWVRVSDLGSGVRTSIATLSVPAAAIGLAAGQPFDFAVESYTNLELGETPSSGLVDRSPDVGWYTMNPTRPRFFVNMGKADTRFPSIPAGSSLAFFSCNQCRE
ncbi:MAG: S8 family serine peptidase [Chloroflexi bacterium]|nr:S8 family serine peptidase [Chloroflexota bacterium]